MTQIKENGKPYPFKSGSQNDRILQYLLTGKSLLNHEIREKFSVLSHTRRISELREHGYNVQAEQISDGVWRYWLPVAFIKPEDEQAKRERRLFELRVLIQAYLKNEDVAKAQEMLDEFAGVMKGECDE